MRWIQGGGTIDGVKNLLKMGEDRKKPFHFTVNDSSQKTRRRRRTTTVFGSLMGFEIVYEFTKNFKLNP